MLKLFALVIASYASGTGDAGYAYVPGPHAPASMTVTVDGRTLVPGKAYYAGYLTGPKDVEMVVRWESAHGPRETRLTVALTPRYVSVVRVSVPLEWAGTDRPPDRG